MIEWDTLTEEQRKEAIKDFQAFLKTELMMRKRWLEKAIEKYPDKVSDFVFANGRLPQMGEIETP